MGADLLPVLARTALVSGAAIVLVLLLRRPLRSAFGARVAYAAWALVPLAILAMSVPAPGFEAAAAFRPFEGGVRGIRDSMEEPTTAAAVKAMNPTAQTAADPRPVDWPAWAVSLWMLGMFSACALLWRQQRRFVRGLGALRADGDGLLRAQDSAGCPALIGALRPKIVLPADFDVRYSAIERELVLAHERIHLARGDVIANALAAGLRCVFWFNPLIHWATRRFRFDQELACDAAVLAAFPQARRPYADAMLKTQLAAVALPVGCHWQSSHPLKERIAMLKQPLPGRVRRGLGLAAVALVVGTGTFAAWAVQAPSLAATQAGGDAPPALLGAELPGDTVRVAREPIGEDKQTFTMSSRAGGSAYAYAPLGRRFRFEAGRGGHRWQAQAFAVETPDGTVELVSEVIAGAAQVDRPRVVLSPGQPERVRIEDRDPATGKIRSGVLLEFQLLQGPSLLDYTTAISTVASRTTLDDGRPVYDSPDPRRVYSNLAGDEDATVVYHVLVGRNGRAVLVELEPGSVQGEIDAALPPDFGESYYNERFRPAMRSGTAVESWVRQPVRFVGKRQQAREQREHEAREAALRADRARS